MESEWIRGGCIGKGSFGTVSLAYDKSGGGRVFAVKSVPLNPPSSSSSSSSNNSIAAIENEIEILRSLNSSHVVSYLGDSTTRGWRNLHMEYVPGGTLADVAGTLEEAEVRAYTRRIVQGLLYLHTVAGVVHSDVKGRNVLAGPAPGLAKLADFGSARRLSGNNRPALIGGTPLWMAPELLRGAQPERESDIWSLGCTVIEMITGSHPWKNSGQDNLNLHLLHVSAGNQLPEFPSKLSKTGRDFLDKCLRRRPKERWTAEQLLQHPFLTDDAAAVAETGRGSPRSTLHWANLEFDEEEEAESCGDDVVGLGRERIKELAENNNNSGGIWIEDWGSEGWEVVRNFGGETGEERIGELEVGNWEARGSGLSNEVSSGCSCSCSCCDCQERERLAVGFE